MRDVINVDVKRAWTDRMQSNRADTADRVVRRFLAIPIVAFSLTACDILEFSCCDPGPAPSSPLELKTFDADCSDLFAYAANDLSDQFLRRGPSPVFSVGSLLTEPPAASGLETTAEQLLQPGQGHADETDVVKSDSAGHLYVLSGRWLSALSALPPADLAGRPVRSLELGGGISRFYATDLLLDEPARRLVILANQYDQRLQSVSIILDISDPLSPREISRLILDGKGLATRQAGGRVHRASRHVVPLPSWFYNSSDILSQRREEHWAARERGDTTAAGQIENEILAEIGRRVAADGGATVLPILKTQLPGASAIETTISCDAIARPGDATFYENLVLLDSFSSDGAQRATSGFVGPDISASAKNFYLIHGSRASSELSAPIVRTAIFRVSLPESGPATVAATGSVDDSVQDLSEFDGVLRVASTKQTVNGQALNFSTQVTTLRADTPGAMSRLGRVRDLAPGQQFPRLQFIADRGYIETEPPTILDLSNPAQPRAVVSNNLSIPNRTANLLPLGPDFLLIVGSGSGPDFQSIQRSVQLFEVANPEAVHKVGEIAITPLGSGSSSAEYDSQAFTYLPDSANAAVPGIASIPLDARDSSGNPFSGFWVFRVDPTAAEPLRELGRIRHDQFSVPGSNCPGPSSKSTSPPCLDTIYAAEPRRSVFLKDGQGTHLFTLSAGGLIASNAAAPETELARILLPYGTP